MSSTKADNLYFTATGEEDGLPVIYRSVKEVPDGAIESDYPNLISIYWRYDGASSNGMPDAATNDQQINFEAALDHLDKTGISHLMLVVTGNNRKEWLWYVRDIEDWMSNFNQALNEESTYPIEIENNDDPQWLIYHNFVAGVAGL